MRKVKKVDFFCSKVIFSDFAVQKMSFFRVFSVFSIFVKIDDHVKFMISAGSRISGPSDSGFPRVMRSQNDHLFRGSILGWWLFRRAYTMYFGKCVKRVLKRGLKVGHLDHLGTPKIVDTTPKVVPKMCQKWVFWATFWTTFEHKMSPKMGPFEEGFIWIWGREVAATPSQPQPHFRPNWTHPRNRVH